jgi:hypothetical protein
MLLAMLTPYVNKIIADHQCGFRRKKSNTERIFYIRQALEKKREYNGTVHQLFINFRLEYDSVKREVFYNILLEFDILKKLVRLSKLFLNETHSKIRVFELLSDIFLFRIKVKVKVKLKLSLCLTKHYAMKTYWECRHSSTHSLPRH